MSEWDFFWGDELWGDALPSAVTAPHMARLFPPGVALDPCQPDFEALVAALAQVFDYVYDDAARLLEGADPRNELSFLFSDWQRITQADTPHAHMLDTGRQDPDLYADIAISYGYTDATFAHVEIWTCESECTAQVYEETPWNLVIVVTATSQGAATDAEFAAHLRSRALLGTFFEFIFV